MSAANRDALLAAIEAMQEYRPALQKNKAARKGYVPYMAKKSAACDGEEYGWVNMGNVLTVIREHISAQQDAHGLVLCAEHGPTWVRGCAACDEDLDNMGTAYLETQP